MVCDGVLYNGTADSYLEASRQAGAAAELAASNKMVKYAGLSSQGEFVPLAVESHGPINRDALQFLSELGSWRMAKTTGMFEHLRFYSNGFPLWCNVSIRLYCMMVLLMTTGQSRVHFQTSFVVFFCNF